LLGRIGRTGDGFFFW